MSTDANRLSEVLLVLSSQEKTGEGNSSNTNFSVHLNNSSKTHAIRAAHLLHAHIPNMFNNVREYGNTFTLTYTSIKSGNTIAQHTVTIPSAYYSLTELITAINQVVGQYGLQVSHNPALAPPLNERLGVVFTPTFDETIHTNLVSNYANFSEPLSQPTPSNPVIHLPGGSLPDHNGYLGQWFTVKERTKFSGVQTIDYGPDTASIPASGTFAKWSQLLTVENNGTPGYGYATESNIWNNTAYRAFDGIYFNHPSPQPWLSKWYSSAGQYDNTTGEYLAGVSTTIGPMSVAGEYVQFKFPYEVLMSELRIYAEYAQGFTLAGSMDGSQWYYLTESSGQDHLIPPPSLATYTLPSPTRVRYIRLIVTNALNYTGTSDGNGRCVVNELEMYVSAPIQRTHFHAIYRLDYHDPAYGEAATRPSEIHRIDAQNPVNAAYVTETLVKEFRTVEASREGNVATHQEVNYFDATIPLDFSDPAYTLEPGYYYIASTLPHRDFDQPIPEGMWAISLTADTLYAQTYTGTEDAAVKSLYTEDTSGGQVTDPSVKIALGFLSNQTVGNVAYPYLLANYQLVQENVPYGTIQSNTAEESYDLLTSMMGFSNNTKLPSGETITAPLPYNLNGPDAVLLNSQRIAEGHGVGCGAGDGAKLDQNIIDMVSLRDTPRGQYAWYQPSDTVSSLIRYRHSNDISRLDIQLTDIEGMKLTLPSNYHVSLVLRLIGELLSGG